MFEKVNPSHPDKIADRIAGAIVDLAYEQEKNPKIAVEVLIGHGDCKIIIEASQYIELEDITKAVRRIAKEDVNISVNQFKQDVHLAENQRYGVRCGDNGIFRGVPETEEQMRLSNLVKWLYFQHPEDGKYIIAGDRIIACQSNIKDDDLVKEIKECLPTFSVLENPLGEWTGGINVDTGATNRKLGSDMGDAVTGGGLHGKDLSKADVSVNIYAHLKAQKEQKPVEFYCAIGDKYIDGRPYSEIVEIARKYIKEKGGFEQFAEWGLI